MHIFVFQSEKSCIKCSSLFAFSIEQHLQNKGRPSESVFFSQSKAEVIVLSFDNGDHT